LATTACAYEGNALDTKGAISHRFCLPIGHWYGVPCRNLIDSSHSSLNIRINYHPMIPLPSPASSNIADLFTSPLPITTHHHYSQLVIGDDPPTPTATSVATVASAHLAPTVVAPRVVAAASDSVPTASALPIVLDTGASYSRAPSALDFLPVAHASYGLFRSPILVVSS